MEGIVNLIQHIPLIKAKEKSLNYNVNAELMEDIKHTQEQLHAIQSVFEHETNFDMIETYIFEINSLEKRYSYLMKQARAQHVCAF